MQRSKWTDARLEERFISIDRSLTRIDHDIRDLRTEMRQGFTETRQLIYRLFGGLIVALVTTSMLHGGI